MVLLASGLVTLLFHRANQPRVVGYILAGLLIGPNTPPFSFVSDKGTMLALADLGVVFLMFSLGLEFDFRRLRRVGATALVTAVLDVTLMVWLGFELGQAMGWSTTESLFLGGILCDSSTTILMKILNEMNRSKEKAATLALGISVVEDVLAVGMVALLTGVGLSGGELQPALMIERFWSLGVFLAVVIIGGLLVVPRVLNYLARFNHDELLVVGGVGMCFGVSLAAVKMELSMALGAVLVGMLASESRVRQKLAAQVEPLRSLFSAVFFVSVGLMLDLAVLRSQLLPVTLATACIVLGKFITNSSGTLLTGQDTATAFRVGSGMAQTGEFAFIIAALGLSLNATGPEVYQVGVAATVLSIVISPYLIRFVDGRADAWAAAPRVRRWTDAFQLYSEWVGRIRQKRQPSAMRQIIRRSLWMMGINTLLIAGLLTAAAYIAQRGAHWFPEMLPEVGVLTALLWVGAMLAAMPLYLVTFRKFNAMGMVLAEIGLPLTVTGVWARHMRTFIAQVVTLTGGAALGLMTLILSASMLPSRETLFLMLALVVILTLWGRRRLLRVYQMAQTALTAVLHGEDVREDAPDDSPGSPAEPPASLDQMRLATVPIPPDAVAVGQTLRLLALRTRTGVSVVGVERAGQQMVNPDPDLRLQPGDRLVMLGGREEVQAARALLLAPQKTDKREDFA